MTTTKSVAKTALFVDFDNVLSSLCELDLAAAEAFADDPMRWLCWIEGEAPDATRRILLRKCYLNPNGIFHHGGERTYFSTLRANLVLAGFQVVDCPPLTRGGKTSADMIMVMDILDALGHATHFDEFVVISSDADFTPVLQRLRAHDRRTLVVAVGPASQAYRAAADRVVGSEDFIQGALAGNRLTAPPVPTPSSDTETAREVEAAYQPHDLGEWPADTTAARALILAHAKDEIAASPGHLLLSLLGLRLLKRLGPQVKESAYGGAGSLAQLLSDSGEPCIEVINAGSGQGFVRDPTRHPFLNGSAAVTECQVPTQFPIGQVAA
jgi:hypothetical protein